MSRWTPVLVILAFLGACAPGGPENDPAAPQSREHDLPPEVEGGLSEEEIERRGREMSPEQAERMGIVDTTIHVETPPPGTEDTVFIP
jgi:hypothetical protein